MFKRSIIKLIQREMFSEAELCICVNVNIALSRVSCRRVISMQFEFQHVVISVLQLEVLCTHDD